MRSGRHIVPPHPKLREQIKRETTESGVSGGLLKLLTTHPKPPTRKLRSTQLETPPQNARVLRGTLRIIVVLVEFADCPMKQTARHFGDLFFSTCAIATGSVREYYTEVSHGLVDITGDAVGPFVMPLTLAEYVHGAAGIGDTPPNAQTMARDAVIAAAAATPAVNFDIYDNDGNGFVDAFVIVHAGQGAELTGSLNDLWSHKWVLEGGAYGVNATHVFDYLTVSEDCRIGACCHELGHLLFNFPDLYDTDYTSQGVGDWCLMGSGAWGEGGDVPSHPSAWCKLIQGWVEVENCTTNAFVELCDVKNTYTVLRLWGYGNRSTEYFLVENRQRQMFDRSLPASGLLVWHIDEMVENNTNENHYMVALVQADGRRDLEHAVNLGDDGDPFPGSVNNLTFAKESNPNSQSYNGGDTCVAVTNIGTTAAVMRIFVQVDCRPIRYSGDIPRCQPLGPSFIVGWRARLCLA